MNAALEKKLDLVDAVLYRDQQGFLWKLDSATRAVAKQAIVQRPYLTVQAALLVALNTPQSEPARI